MDQRRKTPIKQSTSDSSFLTTALLTPLVLMVLFGMNSGAQQLSPPELTLDQAIDQAVRNNASLKTANLETRRAADDLAAHRTRRFANTQILAFGSQLLTRPTLAFFRGHLVDFYGTRPHSATERPVRVAP